MTNSPNSKRPISLHRRDGIGRQPRPAALLDLPGELILYIQSWLTIPELLAMGLANNQLHILTNTLIYTDVQMTWRWYHNPPIMSLLQTILHRPKLGQLVLSLRLDGTGFDKYGSSMEAKLPPNLPVLGISIRKASKAMRSLGVPHADSWIEALESGSVDALVALLVALLPNLRRLHLGPNFTIENGFLGAMFRAALCTSHHEPQKRRKRRLPKFENLSHVTLTRRAYEYSQIHCKNALDVFPYFYLPALRSLSLSIDNPLRFKWPGDHAPNPANLASLELHRIRETRLEPIVSVLKGLEKLRWHWMYESSLDEGVSNDIIELDLIPKALRPVYNTLTELSIDARVNPAVWFCEKEPPGVAVLGSLSGISKFDKLRRLRVPWVFMKGLSPSSAMAFPTLPPSLEFLTLTVCLSNIDLFDWEDSDVLEAVRSWLKCPFMNIGHMRKVDLPVPLFFTDDPVTNMEIVNMNAIGVRAISKETGVHMTWMHSPGIVDDQRTE